MRTRVLAVLLLLLPGLLLPAGTSLRVCRCATRAAAEPEACCAARPEPVSPQPACACCRSATRPGQPHGDVPSACAKCGCAWIGIREARQEVVLPKPPCLPHASPLVAAAVVWSPPPPAAPEHGLWSGADSRPPPPDRQRNLPLRL